jgi:hypothetical protein
MSIVANMAAHATLNSSATVMKSARFEPGGRPRICGQRNAAITYAAGIETQKYLLSLTFPVPEPLHFSGDRKNVERKQGAMPIFTRLRSE